ncbi:tripartite tricarboxylate transporter substrate-binding protein [Rhodoplanes sp. TEM]|uniref:Tripartite tricarboxylate transporter substrate-binding protein n=1 Tax=Rhodoplanes tepidamans TaxID=200616 RepID=A0ABT5JJM3_RHOTP|nr:MULTISPECIES: tripartite tricarboxylate transporter substrate-binding protein [Rhodoplanes]MDC7789913.1 tripartite tricarboxylate transporter substrate-binding protein [Rhodoplanes tepidamans]MDC7987757.1 tripartite tricarboxylate transporter substrate-binding protein [Rhodoplanes sp. TEM]MDQ0358615.1 tripartite-type tricarboxylate transporter receptor subunit TctC [Rhodoplanes tepidamans]
MKRVLLAAAWAAAAALGALPTSFVLPTSQALAQSYPTRPVTMVVPLGPGGSTDVIARVVAEGMRAALGQPVIVENTTGAGGTVGVGRVARAAPDGYTFGIGHSGTNVVNGAIYPLQYDLMADFEPIGLISTQPFFIVARKTMPAKNLAELVAWIKENPGKVSEGTSGVGTPSHISGVLLQNTLGVKWTMVPYRGAGQSMQDLIAGNTDIQLDTPATSMPHIQSGLIKVYAVTNKERLKVAPDVPTTDEAGLPGFYYTFWHALWAPKGTPKEAIDRLNAALRTALADPATRKKLEDLAQVIFPPDQQTPAALAAYQKAEIDKWWPIVKSAGIRAE